MAGVGAGLPVVITELFINNFNFGSYTYSNKNNKLFQSIDITQLSKSTIKYTINLQYIPDTFSKGEANYFESMLHTLITDTEEVTKHIGQLFDEVSNIKTVTEKLVDSINLFEV